MIRRLIRLIGLLGLAGAAVASAQYTVLTGTLQASNGLPAANYTLSFTPSQWGFVAGTGVVVNTTTYCGTDPSGSVVGLTNPIQPTLNTPSYSGGTLAAGNYFVVFTWYTATSTVTQVSPESTAQLTASGNLQIAPPSSGLPAGAVGMNVYIGTTSGGETYQGQTVGSAVYTQSTALTSGATPPSSNTTVCKQVANDAIWPVGTGYTVSLTDPSGNTLPGYPMVWQLLGPNTTINLSNGLPYYHGVVTYPVPILASPLNHVGQSISGGLSLGTYAMLAGSFGNNVVTPAWGLDLEASGSKGMANANGGYLVNGATPANGVCLGSNGTAYNTATNCGYLSTNPNVPTFAAGPGLGTGGSVTVEAGSNDFGGLLLLNVGTSPGYSDTLFTETLGIVGSYPTFLKCTFDYVSGDVPATGTAGYASGAYSDGSTITVSSGSAALPASSGFYMVYLCHT